MLVIFQEGKGGLVMNLFCRRVEEGGFNCLSSGGGSPEQYSYGNLLHL